MQGGIDLCKHANASAGSKPDFELRFSGMRDIVDPLICILPDEKRLPCAFQIDFACLRRMPVGTRSHKKLCAKLFFQLEQLLIQSRLRDKEIFGSSCNVVFLGNLNHIFTLLKIHITLRRIAVPDECI